MCFVHFNDQMNHSKRPKHRFFNLRIETLSSSKIWPQNICIKRKKKCFALLHSTCGLQSASDAIFYQYLHIFVQVIGLAECRKRCADPCKSGLTTICPDLFVASLVEWSPSACTCFEIWTIMVTYWNLKNKQNGGKVQPQRAG